MSSKKFEGVEDTLFIPLAARVAASERFPGFFYDEKSMSLKDLDQVVRVNEKSNEYSMMASVCRYKNTDLMIRDFAERNGKCTIVALGCGLETMNYRLEDLDADFVSIDFPSVIENRKLVLGTHKNETMIGSDLLDFSWMDKVNRTYPVIFLSAGVFQYFRFEQVASIIAEMKKRFHGAELIFDATNEVGIKYAQKYVKKTGNTSAMMYFYINDADKFANEHDVRLISVRSFYSQARAELKKELGLYTKLAMKVCDDKGRTLILHLAL